MRISDWSSDVCSSDLRELAGQAQLARCGLAALLLLLAPALALVGALDDALEQHAGPFGMAGEPVIEVILDRGLDQLGRRHADQLLLRLPLELRSEEHTSELQSLMRISYAVFCLKKKINKNHKETDIINIIKTTSAAQPVPTVSVRQTIQAANT